jgi:2',3'-cyclic-nucleotide 2'-phosphodiesterase (5'-nucleotidase family)
MRGGRRRRRSLLDAGDIEDPTNELSGITKGAALARLLAAAGCDAVAVGNAALLRYGPQALEAEAAASGLPHRGVTSAAPARPDRKPYELYFGLHDVPAEPLVQELAADLRRAGADVVVLLSHLGLSADRELVPTLDGVVDVVIGGHSHDVLGSGERHSRVLLAHAGDFARYLGRIELAVARGVEVISTTTVPVEDDVRPHPRVLAELAAIEAEIDGYLEEVIGEVMADLDWAEGRECGVGAFMADVVRKRMRADVGVITLGASFAAPLPAGRLRRGTLFAACPAVGSVSAVAEMTGLQLLELVARGLDPAKVAERPSALRGNVHGFLHVSGAEIRDGRLWVGGEQVEPVRRYRVAGSDWELGTYAGYADPSWDLSVEYDGVTLLREAVEEHLASGPVHAPGHRIHGALAEVQAFSA